MHSVVGVPSWAVAGDPLRDRVLGAGITRDSHVRGTAVRTTATGVIVLWLATAARAWPTRWANGLVR